MSRTGRRAGWGLASVLIWGAGCICGGVAWGAAQAPPGGSPTTGMAISSPDARSRAESFEGVVTASRGDGSFFVQNDLGGFLVFPERAIQVRPQQRVRLTGQEWSQGSAKYLEHAVVTVLGETAAEPPVVTAPDLRSDEHLGELVRVEGWLSDCAMRHGQYHCTLTVGGQELIAEYENSDTPLKPIEAGSYAMLTGVYWLDEDDQTPAWNEVIIRSPGDVRLVPPPPWLSAEKMMTALGVALILILATGGGLVLLRIQLRRQAVELRRKEAVYGAFLDDLYGIAYQVELGQFSPLFQRGRVFEITGYEPEELVNRSVTWEQLVYPEDRPVFHAAVGRLLKDPDRVATFEYRIVRKDGEIRWLQDIARRTPETNGDRVLIQGIVHDITPKKLAEDRLKANEERWSFALTGAREGVWDWRIEEGEIFFSQKWLELFGPRNRPSADPSDWFDRVHPDDREQFEEQLSRHLEGGAPNFESEHRFTPEGGEDCWVLDRGSVVERDTGGKALRMVGTSSDVSSRKAMTDELRRTTRQYRDLVDSIDSIVWESDPGSGQFEFISPQVERILGYPLDVWLTRPHFYEECIVEEDREAVRKARARALQQKRPYSVECRIVSADGRVRWIENRTSLVIEDGQVLKLRGLMIDVTELRRSQDEARKLAALVEQAMESIVIADLQGRIEYANPAFYRTSGYGPDEVLGMPCQTMNRDDQDPEFKERLCATLRAGNVWTGVVENQRKNGDKYSEAVAIFPLKDSAGAVEKFAAVKRDVTREIRLEEQLRHTQKMESVGKLAGGIAHEFNNLLMVIHGHIRSLREGIEEATGIRTSLGEIEASAKRATDLTQRLLLFSRKQPVQKSLADLVEVVRGTAPLLRRLVGPGIEVDLHFGPDLLPILADRSLIEQVMVNLAVNARQAMEDGGRLSVGVELLTGAAAEDVSWLKEARQVMRLTVEDTGSGIAPSIQERIFEPFFTTRGVGEGAGLGLSIVYGIVTEHGGNIRVQSEPGQGTRFEIDLPAVVAGAAIKPEPERSAFPMAPGRRVLVVEDEPAVRQLLVSMLKRHGCTVTQASSADEALRRIESHGLDAEIVLTDMVMPGDISGVEFIRRLRTMGLEFFGVLMSGYSTELDSLDEASRPWDCFLSKPFSTEKLAEVIQNCPQSGVGQSR